MTEPTRRNVLRGAAALAIGGAAATFASSESAFAAPNPRYPFVEGAFEPVKEEVTAFGLPVTGRIPQDLCGRYLRTGPNVLGLEDPRAHHWMLGEGMVHGVRLRDGKAEWYRNRWVRSSGVAAKLGERYPWPVPAEDFAPNTHVIGHHGRILTLQESGAPPYELDGELNTLGPFDFGGSLQGSYTAHTKFDARADELHAVTYHPTWDHVRHLMVDRTGRVVRTTRIPVSDSPMMHDFGLTENYVVVFDVPVTFDPRPGKVVPYKWNPDHPARVGVMNRDGGPVRWFGVDPVFYSHTLNAYEQGSTVVIDLTTMPPPFEVAGKQGFGGPSASGPPVLERWTIDLARGRVRRRVLDDRPQEFPRVNESLVSRRHRYGYSASPGELFDVYLDKPSGSFGNALIKHDLRNGRSEVHRFGRGADASEAVFVPSSRSKSEDDGYALAYVNDPDRNASDLVILAAQDFTAKPLARIHLPRPVPLGFHGSWVAD
ncbi:carotenoid oxygenase family protein [Amycolatopsis roodepoortensis]|uniref:carotenoid oxygenase family protein n=1 Tax=Amycolatopsis roodepoortensis TaxID=700274 RepID=UPI00214C74A1|nr:carotenoid oxygenase family protein [Amycolatopsis roodepoortensis]UUV32858.1 carotenoid oxygenase family protein [Amycolatopsis roodepoortensis]